MKSSLYVVFLSLFFCSVTFLSLVLSLFCHYLNFLWNLKFPLSAVSLFCHFHCHFFVTFSPKKILEFSSQSPTDSLSWFVTFLSLCLSHFCHFLISAEMYFSSTGPYFDPCWFSFGCQCGKLQMISQYYATKD